MSTWVLDASVLIKSLFIEPQHEIAAGIWAEDHHFIAPVTALPECANAALRKVRHEGFALDQARAALAELSQLGVQYLPLQPFQAAALFDVARSGGFTSHDAVYLLLAEDHDARVLTADGRLLRAAAESGRWQGRVVGLSEWKPQQEG